MHRFVWILLALVLLAAGAAAQGNVTATLSADGSRLTIVGDAAGNHLRVFGTGDGAAFRPEGGTTINGSSADFFVPSDSGIAVQVLTVDLRGGDDELKFEAQVAYRMVLRMGAGNDQLQFADAGGRMSVDLGSGDDFCGLADSNSSLLRLRGGSGDDTVRIDGGSGTGRAFLHGGSGFDTLNDRDAYHETEPKVVGFEVEL